MSGMRKTGNIFVIRSVREVLLLGGIIGSSRFRRAGHMILQIGCVVINIM